MNEKKGKKYTNLILWKCGKKWAAKEQMKKWKEEWMKQEEKPERSWKFADTETQ